MSDDDLRERIASVVAERNAYFGGHTGRADPKDVAQAIINELGLTKEWQPVSRQILNDGTAIENPTQSRIVGKWERK